MFEFSISTYSVEPEMGFISMTSHVFFRLPDSMCPDDVGDTQLFSMSFDKHDQDDSLVLGGINNVYWNDTFMIPAAVLNFIQANYSELLRQAEYELKHNAVKKQYAEQMREADCEGARSSAC